MVRKTLIQKAEHKMLVKLTTRLMSAVFIRGKRWINPGLPFGRFDTVWQKRNEMIYLRLKRSVAKFGKYD
jgi:hypothetical protein